MTACAAPADDEGERGLRRVAPLPRLPSLKKDNCIVNGKYRSAFVAQENIRLYIWKFREQNVGVLTVTIADCIEAAEFQRKWHSFLNALRKIFPTGMWVRERQPRSGNWHAHAVVNVSWDIKTNFPFDQVRKRLYANVDERLRQLWRQLREISEAHGFGRIELLPIKHSGQAYARYLTKYLTKEFGLSKLLGEERCRLFSVWGKVRFVRPKFTFLTSRIIQKKKLWLAQILELPDETCLASALGPRWWFHIGEALSQVIMPIDFYRVGSSGGRDFDQIGMRQWIADWMGFAGEQPAGMMERSHFNLFYNVGVHCFEQTPEGATRLAINLVEKANPKQLTLWNAAPAKSNGGSKSCNAVPA